MQSIIDDNIDDSEQATSIWMNIVGIAQEIEEVDINTENRDDSVHSPDPLRPRICKHHRQQ